jgi:hypothetical protein
MREHNDRDENATSALAILMILATLFVIGSYLWRLAQ